LRAENFKKDVILSEAKNLCDIAVVAPVSSSLPSFSSNTPEKASSVEKQMATVSAEAPSGFFGQQQASE
jgi:hypothetical protein